MALFDFMQKLSDGRPSWLDGGHYANIRRAAEEIKTRTGLECYLDLRTRRVFFGRTSPSGLIGWLFEHPLFRPDNSRIMFGAMDRDIRVDDVCQIVGYANAPDKVKERWEAQRKWCEERKVKDETEKFVHNDDRRRELEKSVERFFDRMAMGKHYRRTVAMS